MPLVFPQLILTSLRNILNIGENCALNGFNWHDDAVVLLIKQNSAVLAASAGS